MYYHKIVVQTDNLMKKLFLIRFQINCMYNEINFLCIGGAK